MIHVNARAIIELNSLDQKKVIVQYRTKKGEECYEFPGGRVEEYESLFSAIIREVKEETGLDIIELTGQDDCIITNNESQIKVECIKPYAVYQTIEGPVDSMGVYFKCKAKGELLSVGDDSKDIKWITLSELKILLDNNFSGFDRAAAIYYLRDNNVVV